MKRIYVYHKMYERIGISNYSNEKVYFLFKTFVNNYIFIYSSLHEFNKKVLGVCKKI